ncbi:hypothetical protein [Nostoc sp.]|uniref:hypothetical protein n=1 Tax=Nostoc sp. TaxID=1180 RepID=UPI002FF831B5
MTLLTEIQTAQSLLHPPFVNKQLLVRSPLSVIELFNPSHQNLWLFDPTHYDSTDTDDYAYLRLFPKYEPQDVGLGDRSFKPSFSRIIATTSTVQRTFQSTIFQSQGFIYRILERLILIAETSIYNQYTPIKIVDFCKPEAIDDSTTSIFNGEPATVRFGRIDITKIPAFVRGWKGEYVISEWEFKFSEARYRN